MPHCRIYIIIRYDLLIFNRNIKYSNIFLLVVDFCKMQRHIITSASNIKLITEWSLPAFTLIENIIFGVGNGVWGGISISCRIAPTPGCIHFVSIPNIAFAICITCSTAVDPLHIRRLKLHGHFYDNICVPAVWGDGNFAGIFAFNQPSAINNHGNILGLGACQTTTARTHWSYPGLVRILISLPIQQSSANVGYCEVHYSIWYSKIQFSGRYW